MAQLATLDQLQSELNLMKSDLADIIPPQAKMPVERMVRTIILSIERDPALLQCTRSSIINAAWSAGVLGLEVDGVTGQAYLVKFKDRAQLVIGFKGHSTIAGRSGFLMKGGCIYEGDEWHVEGPTGVVSVDKPQLGGRTDHKRIRGAYCNMVSNHFPAIGELLDVDEIEKIRRVSKRGDKGPWMEWYDQQAIKSAKKRMAKNCPLNLLHLASALDDQAEIGKSAHIRPDGALIVDGKPGGETYVPRQEPLKELDIDPVKFAIETSSGRKYYDSIAQWRGAIIEALTQATKASQVKSFMARNKDTLDALEARYGDDVSVVRASAESRLMALQDVPS